MRLNSSIFDHQTLDNFARGQTFIHGLDPRAKLLITAFFIVIVVSFDKYSILPLIPFLVFPVLTLTLARIPVKPILTRLLIASPFVVLTVIFNPWLDTQPWKLPGNLSVNSGWISFFSVSLKFILTISMTLLLIATTSFSGVCRALKSLGLPAVFTEQLLFLYRYLFTLIEEGRRINRARDLRDPYKKNQTWKTYARILGVLLIRTIERAERIYLAMKSRGFEGVIPGSAENRFQLKDFMVLFAALAAIIFFRFFNLVEFIGTHAESLL
jgi:cobalt/nickel transport system permease protein